MIATYIVYQSRRFIKLHTLGHDPVLISLDGALELLASLPGAIMDLERAKAYQTGWFDKQGGREMRDDSRIPK